MLRDKLKENVARITGPLQSGQMQSFREFLMKLRLYSEKTELLIVWALRTLLF